MRTAPDLRLGDRYVLAERIAVGGMGEVWRAHDDLLGRPVAVKVLKEEFASDPSFLERFRAEARHTAALSHPGIANVFDYGEAGDSAYLVMELVDGEPLSHLLAREGTLSPARTLDVVGQVGLALQAAHDAGVIHRDIKPGNLLVRPDGVVKVTDFGIARAADAAPLTQTGMVVGTAHYLSPEQSAGRPVTGASDVYALGVVAYECLAGRRPFSGDNPVAIALAHMNDEPAPLDPSVPEPVRTLVGQALAKDPARRPTSAGDFGRTALALAAAIDTGASTAPLVQPPRSARPPGASQPTRQFTAAAAVGAPAAAAGAPAATREPLRPIRSTSSQQRRSRNVLLAIVVVVVVIAILLIRGCGGTASAAVPGVVGKSKAAAEAALSKVGLKSAEKTVRDTTHPAGYVLAQNPKAGTKLSGGDTVALTLASGQQMVSVNSGDYVGKRYDEAAAKLRSLGLTPARQDVTTGQQPPDTVTAVSPTGRVGLGSTVTLTVAQPARKKHDKGKGMGGDNQGGDGGG